MAIEFKDKQRTALNRIVDLRNRATNSQLVFKKKLDEAGINYIFQKAFIQCDYYCIVDFYLPKPYKICIQIDGKYHEDEKQVRKDWARDKYLTEKRGFKVIRITNEQAEAMTAKEVLSLFTTKKFSH